MIDSAFVENLYRYSRKRIDFLFPGIKIDHRDIAHSVLVDDSFDLDGWRKIVDKLIYAEVSIVKNNTYYSEINNEEHKSVEDIWRCNKCGVDLPKSRFRWSWKLCNHCYYIENRAMILAINKKYRINNRDRLLERRRELRLVDIDRSRELERASYRRRYKKDKDSILATNKKSYLKNREKRLQYLKDYYKKNKDKWQGYDQTKKQKINENNNR